MEEGPESQAFRSLCSSPQTPDQVGRDVSSVIAGLTGNLPSLLYF